MRITAKAVGLVVVSFFATIVLAIGSAFTAAFAFGATALIVPGTGTPDATNVGGYMQNARDYYMGGTACANGGCTDADLHSVVYPASFFPLSFIPGWCVPGRCEKWDDSVADGVQNLDLQLRLALMNPDEKVVIFGYSQGGAVVTNELLNIKGTPLLEGNKDRIQVVVIGNVDNPAGGLFTRLGLLGRIPFVDVTTGLATPIDTGLPITSIRFEYDGVSDSPKYFGNPLAVLNALAGFDYIHGTYLDPNQNGQFQGLPNEYTPGELLMLINDPANAKFDAAGNKYVRIPTKTLPIVRPFLDLAAQTGTTTLVKPIVDLISPVLRVLIDLGYDPNENPGVNSPLSILPFSLSTDPVKLGIDLVAAVIQGIQDAIRGGPAIVAPATTTMRSTLAATVPQTQQQNKLALVPDTSEKLRIGTPSGADPVSGGGVEGGSRKSNLATVPVLDADIPIAPVPLIDGLGLNGVEDVEKDKVDVEKDKVDVEKDKVTKDTQDDGNQDKQDNDKQDNDKQDSNKQDNNKDGADKKAA